MSTFSFDGGIKSKLFGLMLIGGLLFVLGLFTQGKEKKGHGGHGDHGDGHTEVVEHHGEAHFKADHHEDDHHEETVDNHHDQIRGDAEHLVNELQDGHTDNHVDGDGNYDGNGHETPHGVEEGHHESAHADGHHNDDHGAHGGGHGDDHHELHHSFENAPKHIIDAQTGGHHGHHGHEKTRSAQLKQIITTNAWVLLVMAFWIGVTALFFIAGHTIAWAGWYIQVQKVSLALTSMIPVAFVLGIIVFILGKLDIFEWTHLYLFEEGSDTYDSLLALKQPFLNTKGFAVRSFIYFGVIMFLVASWWKNLRKQDESPSIKFFSKSRVLAATTIVLVAIIDAFGTWDWVMSIEPHWYSTLYAWYNFASAAVTMFAATILIILVLQKYGYLPNVNDNHLHDLGKYMFAISVFWTYLWFSQYMLIWYGNIPEETLYFKKRYSTYPVLFIGAFVINFLLPFFILMKRKTKRSRAFLIPMCVILIFGHWVDFFNMIVVPNVPKGGFGFISIGLLLFAAGLFGFVVFTALTKVRDLESKQHPYYKESLKHHI